ncbi:hypothetical protein CYMTET_10385 [Cymbomonas tetramitiformis]|uniref:Polysaccharide pyruvyl transferase domain-containing protein n=1 Tax=Cymbomonas tetramitiformis TaxID=36881 RepID=A0AAE0GPL1_9CHLO|nr:hypothetical protein CYMTET_10385 [Cymbomonas tetramitiformis]|eukprot:gene13432-15872_t
MADESIRIRGKSQQGERKTYDILDIILCLTLCLMVICGAGAVGLVIQQKGNYQHIAPHLYHPNEVHTKRFATSGAMIAIPKTQRYVTHRPPGPVPHQQMHATDAAHRSQFLQPLLQNNKSDDAHPSETASQADGSSPTPAKLLVAEGTLVNVSCKDKCSPLRSLDNPNSNATGDENSTSSSNTNDFATPSRTSYACCSNISATEDSIVSALLDNGEFPFHFEVAFPILRLLQRTRVVRRFIFYDTFVSGGDRLHLIDNYRAALGAEIAIARRHTQEASSDISSKRPSCGTKVAAGATARDCGCDRDLTGSIIGGARVDLHVHLTVYRRAYTCHLPNRNSNRVLLFLHRADPLFANWTNAIFLTTLARHLTSRWIVPSEFCDAPAAPHFATAALPPSSAFSAENATVNRRTAQNKGIGTMEGKTDTQSSSLQEAASINDTSLAPAAETTTPVYLIQGHLDRRDVQNQLLPLLTNATRHLNFQIKILTPSPIPAALAPHVASNRDRVAVYQAASDAEFRDHVSSCSHILLLIDPHKTRRWIASWDPYAAGRFEDDTLHPYLTTQPTSSMALGLGFRLRFFGSEAVQRPYMLDSTLGHFYNDTPAALLSAFQESVQSFQRATADDGNRKASVRSGHRRPGGDTTTTTALYDHPWYGPGMWDGVPCRQRKGVYYFKKRDNFGDELNRDVLSWITGIPEHAITFCTQFGCPKQPAGGAMTGHSKQQRDNGRLLAIGSVIGHAAAGDVVWGSGIHEKSFGRFYGSTAKDLPRIRVHGVRGPLSQQFLNQSGAVIVPDVIGDPALLLPLIWPDAHPSNATSASKTDACVVAHYNDYDAFKASRAYNLIETFTPGQRPRAVVDQLRQCSFVATTSLHGLIFAEALGIPARPVRNVSLGSADEGVFKYNDYLHATGRATDIFAASLEEAIAEGAKGAVPGISPDVLRRLQRTLLLTFPFHEVFEQIADDQRIHQLPSQGDDDNAQHPDLSAELLICKFPVHILDSLSVVE